MFIQPYRNGVALPELLAGAKRITVSGSLCLVAYVPPKATLNDAVNVSESDVVVNKGQSATVLC